MSHTQSALQQMKHVEGQVTRLLSALDADSLDRTEQKLVATIKRQFTDARLDIRDYEYSDTQAEQARHGKTARKSLDNIRKTILEASEHNIFSAIDVALLTAQLEGLVQEVS